MAARHAVYFAPAPDTRLWAFGSRVLGYDAFTGKQVPPLIPEGFSEADWTRITAAPRRYGFHATLKAPFALAEGRTEADLREAARVFAAAHRPFALPELVVRCIGGFVALAPAGPSALDALAGACVEAFEPFRAPLTPEVRANRLAASLSVRERAHLDRWGYPYVFEDFRFHMTLTGSLPEAEAERACAGLARLYAAEAGDEPVRVEAVTLFADPGEGGPFRIVGRFGFGPE